MCSAKLAYNRDFFDEVGFVSGRVRRGQLSVGTCSVRSGYNRDEFGNDDLV